MSKKFDQAYFRALKSVAKISRTYDPLQRKYLRIAGADRPILTQQARWQTMEHPKNGRHAYVRSGAKIYQLGKADIRKWQKREFREEALPRIARPAFERYQGTWHYYPADRRTEQSGVKIGTAGGDIVHYLSLDYDDYGRHGIEDAMLAAMEKSGRLSKKTLRMPHYDALLAVSKKTGWPERYKTDLTTHDKRELRYRDPSLPFGWILRASGTHFVPAEKTVSAYGSRNNPPSIWAKIIGEGGEEARYFAWDGVSLRQMNRGRWSEWIDREHRKF